MPPRISVLTSVHNGEKYIADAMSGVEKDPSEYNVPREFRSVKKNFMTLYGMYIGTIMQCAFAGL